MHYSQEFIELKLAAIRESLNRPVVPESKGQKKPVPAHMARLKGTLEERQAEADRKEKLRQEKAAEAERLAQDKLKKKQAAKILAAEQRRQARADKERQRLLNEQEEKRRLPDRIVDPSQMKTIRVDAKTLIEIPIDRDPEEARQKWLEKHSRPVLTKSKEEGPPPYEF